MADQQDYPKVLVELQGAVGTTTIVGRATKLKYGRHKGGDVIWVHEADAAADPERFVPVTAAKQAAAGLPQTPDDVRTPKPVLRLEQETPATPPSSSTEADVEPSIDVSEPESQVPSIEAIAEELSEPVEAESIVDAVGLITTPDEDEDDDDDDEDEDDTDDSDAG